MDIRNEVDIDEALGISRIKHMLYSPEDRRVYIVCNEMNGVLGFYLLYFSDTDPRDH
jgi:hypothetical protein